MKLKLTEAQVRHVERKLRKKYSNLKPRDFVILSQNEIAAINEFAEKSTDSTITLTFEETGIGVGITVSDSKNSEDITDIDSW